MKISFVVVILMLLVSPSGSCFDSVTFVSSSSNYYCIYNITTLFSQLDIETPRGAHTTVQLSYKRLYFRWLLTHLNWQKMSAYSGGTPLACSTVTRKVKMLPTSSCPARPSPRLSLVSSMLPSLRSEESHRGRLGGLYVICIWILSSRLLSAHYQACDL